MTGISFPCSPLSLLDINSIGFSKPDLWRAYVSDADPKGWGPDVEHKCFTTQWSSVFLSSLLISGHYTGDEVFGKTVSLPYLPTLMCTFYPLFLRSCSASFQRNYSICSCRFGVSMVGGELRIFLCCHLLVPPPPCGISLSVFIIVFVSLEILVFGYVILFS